MEVVIVDNSFNGAKLAADAIEALVVFNAGTVIGLATGSSPEPVYEELVARHQHRGLSFSQVKCFLLDEYVGLPPEHPASYRAVIEHQVARPLGLRPCQVQVPDGNAPDIPAACAAYDTALRESGGVDLQLLGIGADGHIGFNEPGSSLGSRTRLKTLRLQTRLDNARFFGDRVEEVPAHVLTQGIGTIFEARHLVLVAWGKAKASAVARAVEGPLTAMVPASILQLHPHATALVDEQAASELEWADHYRSVYSSKPSWQGL